MSQEVIQVEPEIVEEFHRYCFQKYKDLDSEDSFKKTLAENALFYFRKGWFARWQTIGEIPT